MLRINYINLFIVIILGFVQGQSEIGDSCNLEATGSEGTCKLLSDCPQVRKDLQQSHKSIEACGLQGTELIICCPKTAQRVPGEISKKKCKQYANYTFEEKKPPTLLADGKVRIDHCGFRRGPLIVGGNTANDKEFPHMAIIGYEKNSTVHWLCGGTLISKQFILTAAHCVTTITTRGYGPAKYVRLGITNKKNEDHKQEFTVSELIRHPEYNFLGHYNDIALLKLEKPAKLGPYVKPACLYTNPELKSNVAVATAWGNSRFYGGSHEDDLFKTTVDIFTTEQCNTSYANIISNITLKNGIDGSKQLCAGSFRERKDTCEGDTGGPLQIYHDQKDAYCMYDIIGVMSFEKLSCPKNPTVYTRVSHYIKWIEDIVWPVD